MLVKICVLHLRRYSSELSCDGLFDDMSAACIIGDERRPRTEQIYSSNRRLIRSNRCDRTRLLQTSRSPKKETCYRFKCFRTT